MDYTKWDVDGDFGYFFVCKINYSEDLHNEHEELPFFPQKSMIPFDELSPYSQNLLKRLGTETSSLTEPKLVASLNDKEITVYWKYLKTALSCGLKLEKIHRILKFRQERFCEKHINICVNARKNTANVFEKELYKLSQNTLFGKFLENIRDRTKIRFITRRETLRSNATKATYKDTKFVNKKLCIAMHRQEEIILEKFPHIGSAILDLAKNHIYHNYYYNIKPHLGENSRLIFGDTDSLYIYYNNTAPDNIELLKKLRPILDTSNFSPEHELYSEDRKAIPNYFKDESGEKRVLFEIIAVRPKLYHIVSILKEEFGENGVKFENIIRAKGVLQEIRDLLEHEEFRQCVLDEITVNKKWPVIGMKDFIPTTSMINKLALSSGDTKRWWTCSQHSLPFGHKEIKTLQPGHCKFCKKDQQEEAERNRKRRKIMSEPCVDCNDCPGTSGIRHGKQQKMM